MILRFGDRRHERERQGARINGQRSSQRELTRTREMRRKRIEQCLQKERRKVKRREVHKFTLK